MGTFTHPITLHAVSGDRTEVLDPMVDAGSTFSAFPAPVLEELGVESHRTVRLRLANGQIVARRIGDVRVELDGEMETIICVFGDVDATPLTGAVTLESFLLAADLISQRLVPVEGYWLNGLERD